MDYLRNNLEKEKIKTVIKYIQGLGLEVHLQTAARGHQGFFLKNRIDISKFIPQNKIIQTLLHEFAHYIHSKIENIDIKNNGSLSKLFCTNNTEKINAELIAVTNFVDENSYLKLLNYHKNIVKQKILNYDKIIKESYPKFQRSKKFKEFDKYIKHSKAKYLLRFDRIKFITPFLRRVEYYSIDNIEKDFDMPTAFSAYIRLHSLQKKQKRISAKINKLSKYYNSPTELFARFIEGIYIDYDKVKYLAPETVKQFEILLQTGYYGDLKTVLNLCMDNKR